MIPIPVGALILAAALMVAGIVPADRAGPVQVVPPPPIAPARSHCPDWYDETLAAGWPADEWPTVDRVMWCESECVPTAYHPRYGASGLMQVLASWFGPGEDPFDPATNLAVALRVWERQGWQAWSCW